MNKRCLYLTVVAAVLISAASQAVGQIIIDPPPPGGPPCDVTGMLVLDYSGKSDPATTVKSLLTTSYNDVSSGHHFSYGYFMCSTADATHGLGWVDNTSTSKITIARTIYGDADLNGKVELADMGTVLTNWHTGTIWSQGDVDYSGSVYLADLGAVLTNWNRTVGTLTPAGNTKAVPEPSSMLLIAIAVVGLMAYALRWRGRT